MLFSFEFRDRLLRMQVVAARPHFKPTTTLGSATLAWLSHLLLWPLLLFSCPLLLFSCLLLLWLPALLRFFRPRAFIVYLFLLIPFAFGVQFLLRVSFSLLHVICAHFRLPGSI